MPGFAHCWTYRPTGGLDMSVHLRLLFLVGCYYSVDIAVSTFFGNGSTFRLAAWGQSSTYSESCFRVWRRSRPCRAALCTVARVWSMICRSERVPRVYPPQTRFEEEHLVQKGWVSSHYRRVMETMALRLRTGSYLNAARPTSTAAI